MRSELDGVASLVVAARKIGGAVPVNYRFSEDEAAFVTDHSDASLFVDAEFAPCRPRASAPSRRSATSSSSMDRYWTG